VSIASDLCEAIVAREGEALKAGFALPLMSPADLNAAADQVRATAESLGFMRMASPHLKRHVGESIDQVEERIHDFLGGEFARAASDSMASFTAVRAEVLPTTDEIRDLSHTILAVAKVQAAIHHIFDAPADLKELAKNAVKAVGDRLDRIALGRVAGTMRQKQDALAVAVQVARSLEPISNEETVLQMLEDCAVKLGFAQSSDPTQFFLKIIHAMNTSQE
jgi:phage-related minor tail protein